MYCPHIKFTRKIDEKEMSHKLQCDECNHGASDVWLCLQNCCSFVGCGHRSKNHIQSHHQKTEHAICICKDDQQVWCFSCGRKLDEVQLSFSQDIEEFHDNEQCDSASDDNDPLCMDEDSVMIDKDYFNGFEKEMKPRGLTGLTNIGNTCYMNSALQALSNCPSLMQFFLDCPGYIKYLPHANLSECYRILVNEMWSKKRQKCVTPSEFSQCLQKMNPQFRGYRQQDAQEFLRVLMDLLHEELKEPVPPMAPSKETDYKKTMKTSSSRSKRLLGGTTVVEMPADDSMPSNWVKRPRPDKYNLRSFSRLKAEVQKLPQKVEHSANKTPNKQTRIYRGSLPNSFSCPDLREEKHNSSHATNSKGSPNEPHLPTQSMGFVNLASDSVETDTVDYRGSKKFGVTYERALSDSKINYREPSEEGSEGDKTTGNKSTTVEYSSIISDLFNGKIRSSVQCLKCKKISSTMETFQDLSLPIPGKEELSAIHSTAQFNPIISYSRGSSADSKGLIRTILDWLNSLLFGPRVSFEDCLAAFFSADELKGDNMYRCEHCSMLRNGIKECRVYKLPEMLCIHLKRFRHEFYHSSKISSFISFPLEALDMRKYLTSDFTGKCSKYDLVAVITHHGSVGCGHYVACCKNFVTGKWYEFNDSYVSEVSASYVQNAEAYVLFYRKRGESITKHRQKYFRISKKAEDHPTTQYISKKWMTMFYTCAEPGPISNNSFLCRHGAVDPLKEPLVNELVTPLPGPCWEFLVQKFGGGPEVNALDVCSLCKKELIEIDRRRAYEYDTLKELFATSDSSGLQYFISLKWFKEWKNFVDGVNKAPPGPINNQRIGLQRKRVPKSVWDFLYAIYGGRPVLPVDEGQHLNH